MPAQAQREIAGGVVRISAEPRCNVYALARLGQQLRQAVVAGPDDTVRRRAGRRHHVALAPVVGVDVDIPDVPVFDNRQCACRDALVVVTARRETPDDQRVVDDRELLAEGLFADERRPERAILLDAAGIGRAEQPVDERRRCPGIHDHRRLDGGALLGTQPRYRARKRPAARFIGIRQVGNMRAAGIETVLSPLVTAVPQSNERSEPAIGRVLLAEEAVAARRGRPLCAVIDARGRRDHVLVLVRGPVQSLAPRNALLALERLDARVDQVEFVAGTISEQTLGRDATILVRLQRRRNRHRFRDEVLQPARVEVGGRMARIAAVGVDTDAQALRGRVLDLLQIAVAILEVYVTALADRRPGVFGPGILRKLDGLRSARLQINRHFRLLPSSSTQARWGCPGIRGRSGRSCRRSSRRYRGVHRRRPS